ncbi:sugar ABC transporter permease [Paenibacillus marchantiophytorum]|uniref:Sugar ABC transporter permease n=1 Tax=Paenibacillus marchantiophytorum TaxID=1619310 RepID=A0ABQ2BUE3_9BACL|nr:ABC transporter permease subunit [Paenibacillus marchantiophytorum]GGI46587.1 sugar ABC transporter permease [Paenibacillus marchantiophytorum]
MRWKYASTYHYLLMLIPGVALLAVFNIAPLGGIVMAFQHYNPGKGMWHSPFVGWANFKVIFHNTASWEVLRNTLLISISKIVAGLLVPVAFALFLNEVRLTVFKRFVQTIVYLPHFLSWVIIAGIIKDMLASNGLLNVLLMHLGVQDPILFLGSNFWFRPILVLSDVWKEFGFAAIVYLAALTNINPSLYEAADMDGATRMQKIKYISLPGIQTTVVLLATLSLQSVMNAGFDQVFNLYNPVVQPTGDIIDTYVYRVSFEQVNYEIGTAVGLFKSVISLFLIVTAYKLASKFAGYRIF